MPGFIAKRWSADRSSIGRSPHARRRLLDLRAHFVRHGRPPLSRSQDGFLLIEVIISALIVGLIVVATLTGFDVVNRTTRDQRQHNEAVVLAAQSQEQLRSDSSTALTALQVTPHVYTASADGTTYTVTQKAAFVNDTKQVLAACETGNEQSKHNANYLQITSSVTWAQFKRSPVSLSSIITPPTGSGLEVDAATGKASEPEVKLAGVPAIAKYTSVITKSPGSQEGTTGTGGCFIFGGIPATSATVEAGEVSGLVTKSGGLKYPTKEVTIAPNLTTHYSIVLGEGGAIAARFQYEGLSEVKHENNAKTKTAPAETVKGDTFVAFNKEMELTPNFEVGSNAGKFEAGGVFQPESGTFASPVRTPIEPIKYPRGNLFPFAPTKQWTVYPGDCTKNDPEVVNGALKDSVASVGPKEAKEVLVAMSHVSLSVYKKTQREVEALKTKAWEALETAAPASALATITNTSCSGAPTPDNETATSIKHVQHISIGAEFGGHLENPFQPFGQFGLCLYDQKKTYTVPAYSNTTVAGSSRSIYLTQLSAAEKTAKTEAAEIKERGEANAKKLEESNKKTQWEAEEKAKPSKLTKAHRTEKENEFKANRVAEEKATKVKREKEESEENTEAAKTEVTVESEKAGCP